MANHSTKTVEDGTLGRDFHLWYDYEAKLSLKIQLDF